MDEYNNQELISNAKNDAITMCEKSNTEKLKRTKSGEIEMRFNFNKCKVYQCNECVMIFNNETDLKNHLETHSNESQCNLTLHPNDDAGKVRYMCSKCIINFSCKDEYEMHLKAHTGKKHTSALIVRKA